MAVSSFSKRLLVSLAITFVAANANAARRALLVGIDDYSATSLPRMRTNPAAGRALPDLGGAVNDVGALRDLLSGAYGFDAGSIVTLTNQAATRQAILVAIEDHLVRTTEKDDIVFFYFAGHGSQVRNLLSDEIDKLDESIVPADARSGSRDIRDKELRRLFNEILDRGGRLTVMLDSCHSGSGARGLPFAGRIRGVKADLRDIHDGAPAGPRPENRGAVVLSASHDFDAAWEVRDERTRSHGAFTSAWLRALREDTSGREPVAETFKRATAILRSERPDQQPVMAADAVASLVPFLGTPDRRASRRTTIAVDSIRANGTVTLQGGWIDGLTLGSELRPAGDPASPLRFEVTGLLGLVRSTAKLEGPGSIKAGTLLEVATWAPPPSRPFRVWIAPSAQGPNASVLSNNLEKHGVEWVEDPTEVTPTHILSNRTGIWMLEHDGTADPLGNQLNTATLAARIPTGSRFFLQLPVPSALADHVGVAYLGKRAGVEQTLRPEDADVLLIGRFVRGRVEYAWIRAGVDRRDAEHSMLPSRTRWIAATTDDATASALRESLLSLRRIRGWEVLATPTGASFPYQLVVRGARSGDVMDGGRLIGNEPYGLALRALHGARRDLEPRYVYAFTVDGDGRSVLLYPSASSGSAENRLPVAGAAPAEIRLGDRALFTPMKPYGFDTYLLLTTDEPLSDPRILEWDPVRGGGATPKTPLDTVLSLAPRDRSAAPLRTSANWSIERLHCRTVAPKSVVNTAYRLVANTDQKSDDILIRAGKALTGGRTAEAEAVLQEAVSTYHREGLLQRESVALLLLGTAEAQANKPDPARGHLSESASKLRQAGDPLGAWIATIALATLEKNNGRFSASLACHRDAFAILHDLAEPGAPFTLETFALIAPMFGLDPESLKPLSSQSALAKPLLLHYFAEPLTHDSYASVLIEAGQLVKAESELNAASGPSQMLGGIFDASIEAHLGLLRRRQRRYDEARQHYLKALGGTAALPMVQLNDQWIQVGIYGDLAELELQAGRVDEALGWSDKAIEIARDGKNAEREASLTEDRGNLLMRAGRLDAAEEALKRALALTQDNGRRASIEANLGALNMLRGLYGAAAQHLERAIALYHVLKDPMLESTAWMVLCEVDVLTSLDGNAEEAAAHVRTLANESGFEYVKAFIPYLDTVRKYLRNEATEKEAREALHTWLNSPETASLELPNDVQLLFDQMLSLRGTPTTGATLRPEGVKLPVLGGLAYMLEGRKLLATGNFAGARQLWLAALAANPSRDLRVGYLALVGVTYWREGDSANAIRYFTDAAHDMEVPIEDLHSDEMLTGYLGSERHAYYDIVVETLAKSGRTADAFDVAERSRARAFLQLLGNTRLRPPKNTNPELVQEADDLRLRIAADERHSADPAALREERKHFESLLARIQVSSPEYASVQHVEPLTVDDVRRDLPEKTTLVSYFVSAFGAHAWVVDANTFEHVSLPLGDGQMRRIVCWADTFEHLGKTRGTLVYGDCGSDPATADEAYDALIAPLRAHIHHARLLIIPHGALHYVPFAALHDSKTNRYLIDDFTIMYAPSASALRFLRAKESPLNGSALILGDPTTTLDSLEGARLEATHVAQRFGTTPKLGNSAKKSAILNVHGGVDLIHIAAHAEYNAANPLFSHISLAGTGADDGNLNVHEILSDVDLTGVNLVVLSACRSGVGHRTGGDEIVGLTRALLYAGSPGVISTLWNIDDEPTTVLMDRFYDRLLGGACAADALRDAQLSLLHDPDPRYADPRLWAPFTVTGDPQGRWKK